MKRNYLPPVLKMPRNSCSGGNFSQSSSISHNHPQLSTISGSGTVGAGFSAITINPAVVGGIPAAHCGSTAPNSFNYPGPIAMYPQSNNILNIVSQTGNVSTLHPTAAPSPLVVSTISTVTQVVSAPVVANNSAALLGHTSSNNSRRIYGKACKLPPVQEVGKYQQSQSALLLL